MPVALLQIASSTPEASTQEDLNSQTFQSQVGSPAATCGVNSGLGPLNFVRDKLRNIQYRHLGMGFRFRKRIKSMIFPLSDPSFQSLSAELELLSFRNTQFAIALMAGEFFGFIEVLILLINTNGTGEGISLPET